MNNDELENVIDFIFNNGYKEMITINDFLKKIEEKDKEIEKLRKQRNDLLDIINKTLDSRIILSTYGIANEDLISLIKEELDKEKTIYSNERSDEE